MKVATLKRTTHSGNEVGAAPSEGGNIARPPRPVFNSQVRSSPNSSLPPIKTEDHCLPGTVHRRRGRPRNPQERQQAICDDVLAALPEERGKVTRAVEAVARRMSVDPSTVWRAWRFRQDDKVEAIVRREEVEVSRSGRDAPSSNPGTD